MPEEVSTESGLSPWAQWRVSMSVMSMSTLAIFEICTYNLCLLQAFSREYRQWCKICVVLESLIQWLQLVF